MEEYVMGQVLHKRARTTEEVRRDIQNSQESLSALAGHYGINQKTVPKWNKRTLEQNPIRPDRILL